MSDVRGSKPAVRMSGLPVDKSRVEKRGRPKAYSGAPSGKSDIRSRSQGKTFNGNDRSGPVKFAGGERNPGELARRKLQAELDRAKFEIASRTISESTKNASKAGASAPKKAKVAKAGVTHQGTLAQRLNALGKKKTQNSGDTALATAVLAGVASSNTVSLGPVLSQSELDKMNMVNAAAFVRSLNCAATSIGARVPDESNLPSATCASRVAVNLPVFALQSGVSAETPQGTYAFLQVVASPGGESAYRVATDQFTLGAITWDSWVDLPINTVLLDNAWISRCVGASCFLRILSKPLEISGQVMHGAWTGVSATVDAPNEWTDPNMLESDLFQVSMTPLGVGAEAFEVGTFQASEVGVTGQSPYNYQDPSTNTTTDVGWTAMCYKFYTSEVTLDGENYIPAQITMQAILDHRFEFIPFFNKKHIFEPMIMPNAEKEMADCMARVDARVNSASANRWIARAVAAEDLANFAGVKVNPGMLDATSGLHEGGKRKTLGIFDWGKKMFHQAIKVGGGALSSADKLLQKGKIIQGAVSALPMMLLAKHHQWMAMRCIGEWKDRSSPLAYYSLQMEPGAHHVMSRVPKRTREMILNSRPIESPEKVLKVEGDEKHPERVPTRAEEEEPADSENSWQPVDKVDLELEIARRKLDQLLRKREVK